MPALLDAEAVSSSLTPPIESSVLIPVTVAYGDGIGPEIMRATLRILEAAGAPSRPRPIESAKRSTAAASPRASKPRRGSRCAATACLAQGAHHHPPGRRIQEPERHHAQDAGAVRQRAPLRGLRSLCATRHPQMDVVIVRENEEDLYGGIEHRQTDQVMQCLKLITRPGCEKIVPPRLRIRSPQRPQEGHLHHQGQHHEDDRWAVPPGLRRDCRRVP